MRSFHFYFPIFGVGSSCVWINFIILLSVSSMMKSVSDLPLLDVFIVCMRIQVAFFVTLIRRNVITSPCSRLTLFVTLIIITDLSPIHVEKDKLYEFFFLTSLNSASSFVSNLPSIIILILTDRALVYIIHPLTNLWNFGIFFFLIYVLFNY